MLCFCFLNPHGFPLESVILNVLEVALVTIFLDHIICSDGVLEFRSVECNVRINEIRHKPRQTEKHTCCLRVDLTAVVNV